MPVIKYKDPQTGNWVALGSGVLGTEIPFSENTPENDNAWIDPVSESLKYKDPGTGEVKQAGASKDDTYTKVETDALLANKADTSSVYTKTEADTLLQNKANTADFQSHTTSKSNPHGVTATQAGAYSKEETNTLLQNKAEKDRVVNPNLLDNWYFGNPVDQRGGYVVPPGVAYAGASSGTTTKYYTVKSTYIYNDVKYAVFDVDGSECNVPFYTCVRGYTGAGYGIDRWIRRGGDTLLNDGYITLLGHGNNLDQITDTAVYKQLRGKTVTISVLGRGNFFIVSEDYANNFLNTSLQSAEFTIVSLTLTVRSDADRFIFHIQPRDENPCDIIAAKLELGSQQTLAHQDADGNWQLNEIPDYGEQLRRCQRYQFVPDIGDPSYKSYQFTYVANASGSGNGNLVGSIPFPVTMRTAPSVVIAGKQVRDNSIGSLRTISSLSFAFTTKDALTYLFGVAAKDNTFIEGHQYSFMDQLIFDANL